MLVNASICSLIWEHGAFLLTAAKLLANVLLTARHLCRACGDVPSRPATARHTGGTWARGWNRRLSSSLLDCCRSWGASRAERLGLALWSQPVRS